MAVNVKMGVDIGGFTAGIKQGQQILKGLNAEMKATDAEFKSTGNAEQKMTQQTKTLNSQLNVQKGIFTQAQQALKKMEEAGIKPTDAAYQKMYATMMNAKAGMNEAQAALNSLGTGAESAAAKANKLTDSVQGISKKMSLEQVINGVNAIKTGLETAAQKAVQLGEDLWDAIMNKAKWADDTATMAQMYGIDIETFERMQKLVTNGMDTSVEAMLKAQDKLKIGIGKGSQDTIDYLQQLGVQFRVLAGDEGVGEFVRRDPAELFWETGRALMEMGEAYDKEAAAQALFGRSWKELIPLFKEYESLEEYTKALDEVNVSSEEDVNALSALYDEVEKLKGNLDTLATDILAQLAPALTDAAEALNGVLASVLDYLDSDDGKQMLKDLGTAVSGLFDDLGKIDPEQVVSGFVSVFTTITDGIKWLVDNKETAGGVLKAIVGAWGLVTIGGNVLKIINFINGITGLAGGSAAAASGAASGASWGTAFAGAVAKAAPWLIGLYTLLNPASSADNNLDLLYDPETHELTQAGREAGMTMGYDEFMNWQEGQRIGTYSGEGFHESFWKQQLENGEAWVAVSKDQHDAIQKFYDIFRDNPEEFSDADWEEYARAFEGQEDLFDRVEQLFDHFTQTHEGELPEDLPEDFFKVPTQPVVEENAAEDISNQVGIVPIKTRFVLGDPIGLLNGGKGFANGLPNVPNDGLYLLHRGERVTPAREVASRNFSSNLYVENMNMSGGMDADGLAAAMAAAQRRAMAAYGS